MYEDKTPEGIKSDILAALTNWSKAEGSFANTVAGGVALELWRLYEALNDMPPRFYIDETSGDFIDLAAAMFGITRKAGVKAAVTLTVTGTVGTTVPAGFSFLTADGLAFVTDEALTLAAATGDVAATAAEVGAAYNVAAGTIISAQRSMSGVTSCTNAAAAAGGVDEESDAALVARYYARLQRPPTSGNAYEYEQWALAVPGVGYAKCVPLWDGAGTVKVLLASPEGEAVTSDVASDVSDAIEAVRPIGAAVTVVSATETDINIVAVITLDGSATLAAIKSAFEAAVADYLKGLIFAATCVVNYNRIGYLLLGIPGVADYSTLTINGGTASVTIAAGSIPTAGTLEVTESA